MISDTDRTLLWDEHTMKWLSMSFTCKHDVKQPNTNSSMSNSTVINTNHRSNRWRKYHWSIQILNHVKEVCFKYFLAEVYQYNTNCQTFSHSHHIWESIGFIWNLTFSNFYQISTSIVYSYCQHFQYFFSNSAEKAPHITSIQIFN